MREFEPSRAAALSRLASFAPFAGQRYASGRNTVTVPHAASAVSGLSPYLRYRVITEHEVAAAVLDQHSLATSEKFLQEVLWRTYWKGWLEMRPSVWTRFQDELARQRQHVVDPRAIAAAENGTTGIAGFDDWARELVATGYLHNHVRMWFASIWIFTLRLPWVLGADFFLRHLLDADAASNTLSWRWVAGLQTVGKHYLATADNIARYTDGRYVPVGLAVDAAPLTESPVAPAQPIEESGPADLEAPSLLLVTHDDLHPESLFARDSHIRAAIVVCDDGLLWGARARAFVASASHDAVERVATHFDCPTDMADAADAEPLIAAARAAGVKQIVTPYAPVGPVATAARTWRPALAAAGIAFVSVRRPWDEQFWPHARKGYFPFRERIPSLLRAQGLQG